MISRRTFVAAASTTAIFAYMQRSVQDTPEVTVPLEPAWPPLPAHYGAILDELNMRIMRGYGASRADLFATLDRPNLQSLPSEPYIFARPI